MQPTPHLKVLYKGIALLIFVTSNLFSGAQVITTFAGTGSSGHSGDGGLATAATFNSPYSIALDMYGSKYIADYSNFCVRKVTASNIVKMFAGNGSMGYSGDGGPATNAKFAHITGVACDRSGNVYISDDVNHCVRKVNGLGIVTTVAGTGTGSYSGDGGPATAATINTPQDVIVDLSGNLYIADFGNDRVRKVDPSGVITTIAGTGSSGFFGDGGPATAASAEPFKLALDAAGNLYITEYWKNRVRIINTSGVINTFAGNGGGYHSGDFGPATAAGIYGPFGVAVDPYGDVLIGETTSSRIRKVLPSGLIVTFAGNGTHGYTGDGGPALSAEIGGPRSILSDGAGAIYFADYDTYVVRKISNGNHTPFFVLGGSDSVAMCSGAASLSINAFLQVIDSDFGQDEVWSIVSAPSHGAVSGFPTTIVSNSGSITPGGLSYRPASTFRGVDSFLVRVSDGITNSTINIKVDVQQFPTVSTITGRGDVCLTSTVILTDATLGGTWTVTDSNASINATTGAITGLRLGLDTVHYVVSNSCGSAMATFVERIDSFPDAGTIGVIESGICPGDTLVLVDITPGGVWSTRDSAIAVVTAAGQAIGVGGGLDSIYYIHSNACGADTATATVDVFDHCSTNVPSVKPNAKSFISPNPCSDYFEVHLAPGAGMAIVCVNDLSGKCLRQFEVDCNKTPMGTCKIGDLPDGVYFVDIKTTSNVENRKLVIFR